MVALPSLPPAPLPCASCRRDLRGQGRIEYRTPDYSQGYRFTRVTFFCHDCGRDPEKVRRAMNGSAR